MGKDQGTLEGIPPPQTPPHKETSRDCLAANSIIHTGQLVPGCFSNPWRQESDSSLLLVTSPF